MNALNSIEPNKKVVSDFQMLINSNFGIHNMIRWIEITGQQLLQLKMLLTFQQSLSFGNYADTARKQATIRYLQYLSSESEKPITIVLDDALVRFDDERCRAALVSIRRKANPVKFCFSPASTARARIQAATASHSCPYNSKLIKEKLNDHTASPSAFQLRRPLRAVFALHRVQ